MILYRTNHDLAQLLLLILSTAPAGDPPEGTASTRVIGARRRQGVAPAGADRAPEAHDRGARFTRIARSVFRAGGVQPAGWDHHFKSFI